MQSRLIVALCATTSLLTLAPNQSVKAQQGAQSTAANKTGLEEIVVTARRREERVQTVPLAVTAFTQSAIEQRQIREIHDLAQHVPSLGVSLSQSDSNANYSGQVRLRGLPGTVIYFADVPIGNADFNPANGLQHGLSEGNFYDLADVEVVKGPQGTLFGKNSVGGLISIQPQRPTNAFEGYLRTTFGNYGDKENELAVNIPVIEDKLLIRVAGQMQQRDGYVTDLATGKDLDNKNYYAWRVGVTVRPTDDFENYLLYDGYWQDSNGGSNIFAFADPKHTFTTLAALGFPAPFNKLPVTLGTGPNITGFFNPATAPATAVAALAAGGVSLYPTLMQQFAKAQALGPRAILDRGIQGIGKDYFYGFTDVARWDVTDDLTIKNIAAARVYKQMSTDGYTPIGLPILNIGFPGNQRQWGNNSVQYSEELQFQGRSFHEKLEWVVGGYLEYDHPLGDTLLASANLGNTIFGSVTYNHFNIQARSRAAFAHGTYDLGDFVEGLKLTGGYRYTWDYAEVQTRSATGVDRPVYNAAGALTNCPALGFADNTCYQSSSANFSSFGWNASLEWQATPDKLLYVRAGNAYRPGGFNLSVAPQFAAYQPEHVTDVEIGAKADWDFWGMHARTNVDAFHSDYKAIQVNNLVSFVDKNGINHTNQLTQNAATATLEGVEFEGTLIPFTGLEIAPHISFMYANYDQYPAVFGAQNGSKPPFLYFPKIAYGILATYHLPIDDAYGDVALSMSYSWYGHQYDSVAIGEIYPIEPSYDLLNVRIDWTNIFGKSYDLSFFMNNATDNLYVQGAIPIYTQLGFTSVTYNAPRMWGFSLKMRFGPGADTGLGF